MKVTPEIDAALRRAFLKSVKIIKRLERKPDGGTLFIGDGGSNG